MPHEAVKSIERCPTCGAAVTVTYLPVDDPWQRLSPREREAVELLMKLGRVKPVAEAMNLSQQTVKNHLASVRRITRSTSMVQAITKLLLNPRE